MKYFNIGVLALLLAGLIFLSGCISKCEDLPEPEVGNQFFTVKYLMPDGTNYLTDVYNKANVVVYADFFGGEQPLSQFTDIEPGFEGDAFGPFYYTTDFIDLATGKVEEDYLYGQTFRYDYFIKKDTFGIDKFTVEFLVDVDDCNAFWKTINFYRNDVLLEEYAMDQMANIRIVE